MMMKSNTLPLILGLLMICWFITSNSGFAQEQAGSPTISSTQAQQGIDDVVGRIKDRYAKMKVLTAVFEQSAFQAVMQSTLVEKGTITIKKPELMIWLYQEPALKTVLLDGKHVWLYTEKDNHLYRESYDNYSQNLFYQLISGSINVKETFAISRENPSPGGKAGNEAPDTAMLKFVPLRKHPTIESIVVVFDLKELFIRETTVIDHFGNKTVCRFTDYKVDPEIKDDRFTITVRPKVVFTDFTGAKLPEDDLKKSKSIIITKGK
jgi:outer membrane lipoprotein-sorting protein